MKALLIGLALLAMYTYVETASTEELFNPPRENQGESHDY